LTELDEWFWDYYDTELFRTNIWDFIDKDTENLSRFRSAFERMVGFGRWELFNIRIADTASGSGSCMPCTANI